LIGSTISHYKILEKLGEGGMGVVYKAEDTRLDRLVALKFLPPHLNASEEDKARFVQEAKAAAAMNHPNVCSVLDIQEQDEPGKGGTQMFIVMEYVDGQTLRDRKGVTLKQAIDIGIQIADGLAAAHEKGIVHRDIKPENIMIRKDGIVQIMDFGLAKLRGVSRLTKEGSTVGTAGYMSPEQVQGLDADHRSDIFSLGALLYELLTGQLPFKGVHETAIMYEVVNVDAAPPSSLVPEIEPELDRIVLECLQKDPDERCQSAKEVSRDLKRYKRESGRQRVSRVSAVQPLRPPMQTSGAAPAQQPSRPDPVKFNITGWIPWVITAVVTIGAIGWALFSQRGGEGVKNVRRLNLAAVAGEGEQILHTDIPGVAISPDGRLLAYPLTKAGSSQLYLRPLNSFQSSPLKGTENGNSPFFSPDGQWIGFEADGRIKKVPLSGGAVETICDAPGFRGASWGRDGRIVFSPDYAAGLMAVPASGGKVQMFSALDSSRNERTYRWPQVLPDGKWVLYTVGDQSNPNSYLDASLVLQSIETDERHTLDVRGEMARYVEPGYLIVARNGTLLAAPFSLRDFRTTRPLSAFISDVSGDPGSGVLHFSISNDGQLVYLPGSLNQELELVWVDREGTATPLALPARPYNTPRISPDGSKVAVTIGLATGSDNDIWIYDLKSTLLNRLTFEKSIFAPVWSRDGREVYCASSINGKEGLMVKPADGSSAGTFLLSGGVPRFPNSISPGGDQLFFSTLGGSSEGDIYALDLKKGQEHPVVSSPQYEYGGSIAPNGKYIVYSTNESGKYQVIVRSYPDLKGKWQVSVEGGFASAWSPDGKEILYLNLVGKMMAVSLQDGAIFKPGRPRELFDVSQMFFPNVPLNNYDITPDGKRFLMVRNARFSGNATSFNVVLNWIEELKREMPVRE
jgi:serine/threonine protein kinase/Tol biopolymer transport system component